MKRFFLGYRKSGTHNLDNVILLSAPSKDVYSNISSDEAILYIIDPDTPTDPATLNYINNNGESITILTATT